MASTTKYQTYNVDERSFLIRPDTTDQLVVDEIWREGIYKFLDPQPGDLILDIGGHIGIAASWFAYHGAIVQTFEPVDSNYEILAKNIAAVPQITAHNFPVMYQGGVDNTRETARKTESSRFFFNYSRAIHARCYRSFGSIMGCLVRVAFCS